MKIGDKDFIKWRRELAKENNVEEEEVSKSVTSFLEIISLPMKAILKEYVNHLDAFEKVLRKNNISESITKNIMLNIKVGILLSILGNILEDENMTKEYNESDITEVLREFYKKIKGCGFVDDRKFD